MGVQCEVVVVEEEEEEEEEEEKEEGVHKKEEEEGCMCVDRGRRRKRERVCVDWWVGSHS